MSYTIERQKRVLELVTDDARFGHAIGNPIFFVSAASCSNVTPKHYDWSVIAHDYARDWRGNIIVPKAIWNLGMHADGGEIKPWGKDVSGLAYVKSWKAAVKARSPIDGWRPRVSIWGEANGAALNDLRAEAFGGDNEYIRRTEGPALYEAFVRLFPRLASDRRRSNDSTYVETHADLLDALYLFTRRELLPFSFYLGDSEHSAFFSLQESSEPVTV